MEQHKKRKRKSKAVRKIIIWTLIILLVIIILLIGYAFYKVSVLDSTIKGDLNRDKSSLRKEKVELDGEPISIALFGIDSNAERLKENSGERSDSIVLLSINPKKHKTVMISIPRDMRSEIVGHDSIEKINHAYAYGGPDMSIKSIEKTMDVPIDHYASINMDGIIDLIDHIGGVDVTSNATFSYKNKDFKKGKKYHLNGEDARTFMASRKEQGAGGDFGRQARQQLVIQSLAKKLQSFNSIPKINQIFDTVGENVLTDMKVSDIAKIRTNYKAADKNIEKLQLEGTNQVLDDGLYYFVPDTESKEDVVQEYRKNLGL
ncbi:LCP family protein [Staphylococcus simulans]|uniref:LCP family protein n=1 Tax=Staphylococcus simulans TaxID=1286 RepID=UPI001E63ADB5|nr:LCP family protein [Staphylococcus simulans]MCD8914596.1 LCP family protein [Staphylococcus simulans]